MKRVESFYKSYRGEKKVIGKSMLGRNIYAFFVGSKRGVRGICQYSIHAREWITSLLALEHIAYGVGRGGVWFIPLANPDGVALCQRGISSVNGEFLKKNLVAINGGYDFSLWKANANCVDLNVNFDACWGRGEKNVRFPASENYIGPNPFSECESRALRNFTLQIKPDFTISYHCLGEEIYWYFNQGLLSAARDKRLACIIHKSTGYPLALAKGSTGGYKDWCICALKIPSFTVEVGRGTHPLGEEAAEDIINKNLRTVRDFTDGFYAG